MRVKLSKIFVPITDKADYSVAELSAQPLQSDFIRQLADRFDLTFVESSSAGEGNLCFAEDREVRPAYRTTISRAEVLDIVLPQLLSPVVNLDRDEVLLPEAAQDFFAKSFLRQAILAARKRLLRRTMLERRDRLSQAARDRHAERINAQLWDLIEERAVRVIHSYMTMGSEVDVRPLLQKALDKGLQVVVPKTLRKRQLQHLVLTDLKNTEAGIFNTYHPKDASEYTGEYDLILVSGLAFDPRGYRVGYGGGYYDTFLADQQAALRVGVCYPFQLVAEVPVEEHDVRLDRVVC
jgi:5-formyltetrahydrofolate cyclo-ligase